MQHTPSIRFTIAMLFVSLFVIACGSQGQPAAQPDNTATETGLNDIAAAPTPSPEPRATASSEATPASPPTETTAPATVTPDLCNTDQQTRNWNVQRVSAERPDTTEPAAAASYIAIGGLTELAWASQWIVQAQLLEICSDADEFSERNFVVSIERTYRGTSQETMVVSGIVDPSGSGLGPEVGASMVLFLSPPQEYLGRERIWTIGGPQGHYQLVDGLVTSAIGPITLTIEDFELAISAALDGNPPENMPVPSVALSESPRGPDLPPAGSPLPSGCGGGVLSQINYGQNMAVTAWDSNQVFIGEVVEQLPSQRADVEYADGDPLIRPVVTDYLLRIEVPVRGLPASIIRVREIGGSVEGCTLSNIDGPLLTVGDRALFFARTSEANVADPTYYVNGGMSGVWRLADDGTFVARTGGEHVPTSTVPTSIFLHGLVAALNGPQPDPHEYGLDDGLVPLDEAPLASIEAFPASSGDLPADWLQHEQTTDGYRFSYPSSWTILSLEQPGAALSLANYPTEGGDWEDIPEGGLKIEIGLPGQPADSNEVPISVGPQGYPGSIAFSGLTGDTYHISVAYEAGGEYRHVAGYFREPADLTNPNLQIFFAIVGSISHDDTSTGSYTEAEAVAHATGMVKDYSAATDPQLVSAELLTLEEALVRLAVESGDDPSLATEGWTGAEDTLVWMVAFDGGPFQIPKCPPPDETSAHRDDCGQGATAGLIFGATSGEIISFWIRDMLDD